MSIDQNKAVIQGWFDALNQKNMGTLEKLADEVFAASNIHHNPTTGVEPMGPENVKAWLHQLLANFAHGQIMVDDLLAERDKVVVRFTVRNVNPAGEPTSGANIYIYRMVDGRIAEIWSIGLPGKW